VHVGMGDVQCVRAGKLVESISLAEGEMRRFPQGQCVMLEGERGQGMGW
jgi:hypothetical protein